jgi:hypothetical protein
MPWGLIIGGALGLIGSMGARSSQRRAQRSQERIANAQLDLAHNQQAFGGRLYNDWYNTFFPLAGQITTESQRDVTPDYARIAADVQGQAEAQRGAADRNLERAGINPADPMYSAVNNRLSNQAGTAEVLARNRARQDAVGLRLKNMEGAYALGSNMPGAAAAAYSGAGSALSGAGNTFGNLSNQYGADAANTASGIGQIAGSIPWGTIFGGSSAGAGASGANYNMTSYGVGIPDYSGGGWHPPQSQPSSRDFKVGITPVGGPAAMDTVMDVPIKSFNYKPGMGPPGRQVGTIAEEAPAEISDGRSVNMSNHLMMLTAAFQDLVRRLGLGGPQGDPDSAAPQPKGLERTRQLRPVGVTP